MSVSVRVYACAAVGYPLVRKGKGVQKFMSLHDGSGEGTLHAQSAGACGGRKYWVWGDDGGNDDKNMDFLSSPGRGSYIEMQESNPISFFLCFFLCVLHAAQRQSVLSDLIFARSTFATGGACTNAAADVSFGGLEHARMDREFLFLKYAQRAR